MTKLTLKDYKTIIKHYGKKMPKSRTLKKRKANNLMAKKLCSCIKKVRNKKKYEKIAICTSSVIKNRGLKYKSFTCKRKAIKNLHKTRKLKFRPKRRRKS